MPKSHTPISVEEAKPTNTKHVLSLGYDPAIIAQSFCDEYAAVLSGFESLRVSTNDGHLHICILNKRFVSFKQRVKRAILDSIELKELDAALRLCRSFSDLASNSQTLIHTIAAQFCKLLVMIYGSAYLLDMESEEYSHAKISKIVLELLRADEVVDNAVGAEDTADQNTDLEALLQSHPLETDESDVSDSESDEEDVSAGRYIMLLKSFSQILLNVIVAFNTEEVVAGAVNQAHILYEIASLLDDLSQLKAGMKLVDFAIEICPILGDLYNLRGMIRLRLEEDEEDQTNLFANGALKLLDAVQNGNKPFSKEPLASFAQELLNSVQFDFEDPVYRDFERAVFLDNEATKLRNKAIHRCMQLDDYDGAINDITKAIQHADRTEPCFADRAMFYFKRQKKGDLGRACVDYRRAVRQEASDVQHRTRFVDFLVRCGLTSEALIEQLEVYNMCLPEIAHGNFIPAVLCANMLLSVDEHYLGMRLLSSIDPYGDYFSVYYGWTACRDNNAMDYDYDSILNQITYS